VSVEEKVRKHFDADALRFDAIYVDQNKGIFSRFIDQVWRGVVRRRLELAVQVLEPLEGKKILDVGCGSGRFCVAYAERGAHVVGVDFAARMIELARQLAEARGVANLCDFRTGTFPDVVPEGTFDASTALGFFDYICDPVPIVTRMRELTQGALVMSFPKASEWRVPLRRFRFWMNGCPLYLYSQARVQEILGSAGLTNIEWRELDRDYLVVART